MVGKEKQAAVLDGIALNRATVEEGPDNLWAMTLTSGSDEKVYVLNSDHLRKLAEEIFRRLAS